MRVPVVSPIAQHYALKILPSNANTLRIIRNTDDLSVMEKVIERYASDKPGGRRQARVLALNPNLTPELEKKLLDVAKEKRDNKVIRNLFQREEEI